MWKIIIISLVVIVIIGGFFVMQMFKGPDLTKFEELKNPRITSKPDVKVIEVPFQVSSKGLKSVFGVLFKTYFKTKGTPKGKNMSAPIARYENAIDMTLEPEIRAKIYANIEWKGSAAIPIPVGVNILATGTGQAGLTPQLTTWQYGEVAEILHIGPYENEPPTVRKLIAYIEEQGYEISGLHEEEYLKGPGSPFAKPEDYYTIIRYPVKKKD